MSKEDLKTFKRRMLGAILATDMAKHADDLASLKQRIYDAGIKAELGN
jgi:hypothetical protein